MGMASAAKNHASNCRAKIAKEQNVIPPRDFCSFDRTLKKYKLSDSALAKMTEIYAKSAWRKSPLATF